MLCVCLHPYIYVKLNLDSFSYLRRLESKNEK